MTIGYLARDKDVIYFSYMNKSLEREHERNLVDMPMPPMFPMIYVDEKQMPPIKDWKVGEDYVLKNADIELLSYEHDAKQSEKFID